MKTKIFDVHGMTCQHCVMTVTKALQDVPGVLDVDVDLDEGKAFLDVDEQNFDAQKAQKAVAEAGYELVV